MKIFISLNRKKYSAMMDIIDFHAHIYPDKIAEKASHSVGEFYSIPMNKIGSVDTLLKSGGEAGVGMFVVQSVATVSRQVQSINDLSMPLARSILTGSSASAPSTGAGKPSG